MSENKILLIIRKQISKTIVDQLQIEIKKGKDGFLAEKNRLYNAAIKHQLEMAREQIIEYNSVFFSEPDDFIKIIDDYIAKENLWEINNKV